MLTSGPAALLLATALAIALTFFVRRRGSRVALVAAITVLVPGGLYATGYRYRGPPSPLTVQLAPGIAYQRIVTDTPAVVHVARIELSRPDLSIVSTPPVPDGDVPAQRVSDFVADSEALIAINGAFFDPFYSKHPLDYYPRTGDAVHPFGITMTDGIEFGPNRYHRATVYFDAEGRVGLQPLEETRWAATGRTVLVADGRVQPPSNGRTRAPRTAIAFDGEFLLLVVVDGRQPGYSDGMRLDELAELLRDLGARWAVEMDGGGSSTMVDGTGPRPRVLNCPIHTRLPCRERPVASQLGVRRVAG